MVTKELLQQFCSDQQQRYADYCKGDVVQEKVRHTFTIGPKYAKIIREHVDDEGRIYQQSSVCYVNLENGDILKGNWKHPETKDKLKGVRGNIFSPERGAEAMTWCSTRYLK